MGTSKVVSYFLKHHHMPLIDESIQYLKDNISEDTYNKVRDYLIITESGQIYENPYFFIKNKTDFNTRQKIIRYLTKELKFFILEFLIYHNYDSKKEYQLRKQKYKFIIYIPNVFFRQI